MATTLPNMSLSVPAIGDSSATYAASVSTSLNNIDAHTHATGSGVQIPTAGIANGAVTQAKRAALGQQISASCGSFSTTNTSFTDVTNLSVSITTTGRPVFVGLIADPTGGPLLPQIYCLYDATPAEAFVETQILRDVTSVHTSQMGTSTNGLNNDVVSFSPGVIWHIDTPAAGTYTYKMQVKATALTTTTVGLEHIKLIAYEL